MRYSLFLITKFAKDRHHIKSQQDIRYICPIYFGFYATCFLWNLSIEDGATRGYENNGILFSFLKSVIYYETNQFNFR